jgi:hypothetical protein
MRITQRVALGTVAVVTVMLGLGSTRVVGAGDQRRLAGSWYTDVTTRDCATGAALRSFPAINTFSNGGELIDTSTVVAPSLRSPGHGTWERLGDHRFKSVSFAFLFSPTGAWVATQKLAQDIRLASRNEFTSTAVSKVYDTAGSLTQTTCATAIAHRIDTR